ncbi:MAG: DUF2652 domain-containing protein [Actinomycetota bacterium]
MTSGSAPTRANGPLLLSDISGYTSFLQSVAAAHRDDAFAGGAVPDAYAMMSDLLDGIVGQVVPPFTLAKLEGDAVFAYATDPDAVPRGGSMLGCLRDCYADFRRRLDSAHRIWTCRCDACSRVDILDLKFVLREGSFVIQSIAGGQELVGPEVVMAHRLLKTGAAELVGHGAYALITEDAVTRFDVPTDGSVGARRDLRALPAGPRAGVPASQRRLTTLRGMQEGCSGSHRALTALGTRVGRLPRCSRCTHRASIVTVVDAEACLASLACAGPAGWHRPPASWTRTHSLLAQTLARRTPATLPEMPARTDVVAHRALAVPVAGALRELGHATRVRWSRRSPPSPAIWLRLGIHHG